MPAWTSAAASTLAYGVITVGWPEVAALSRDSHAPAARLGGSLGGARAAGPVARWVRAGHRLVIAEQGRVDDPGQAGAWMRLPGREQGRQAAARPQAGRQVVVRQPRAHLVGRLGEGGDHAAHVQR